MVIGMRQAVPGRTLIDPVNEASSVAIKLQPNCRDLLRWHSPNGFPLPGPPARGCLLKPRMRAASGDLPLQRRIPKAARALLPGTSQETEKRIEVADSSAATPSWQVANSRSVDPWESEAPEENAARNRARASSGLALAFGHSLELLAERLLDFVGHRHPVDGDQRLQ